MPKELTDIIWNSFLGLLALGLTLATAWTKGTSKRVTEIEKTQSAQDKAIAIIGRDIIYLKDGIHRTEGLVDEVKSLLHEHIREERAAKGSFKCAANEAS